MKNLILYICFISLPATAANLEIVDVKRNITLADNEEPYKDFYIKTTGSSDLKKNLVVKAVRKIQVRDASQKPIGDFKTAVGLLKILHVEGDVAVGREFKLIPRDSEPMLEQIGIMTGDEIDLSGSFVDTSKPARPKKDVADVSETVEAPEERLPAQENPESGTPLVQPNAIIRDI